MENFDQDTRAGYCHLIGTVVNNICSMHGVTPSQLKDDPLNSQELVPNAVLDLVGVLMSMQGFLLEEKDERSAYFLHRLMEESGPVIYEALGVSPSITRRQEVIN